MKYGIRGWTDFPPIEVLFPNLADELAGLIRKPRKGRKKLSKAPDLRSKPRKQKKCDHTP